MEKENSGMEGARKQNAGKAVMFLFFSTKATAIFAANSRHA